MMILEVETVDIMAIMLEVIIIAGVLAMEIVIVVVVIIMQVVETPHAVESGK